MQANVRATREMVEAVEAPEFTSSWHPWSHRDIAHATETAITSSGLEIDDQRYSLNKDGSIMFGVFRIKDSRDKSTRKLRTGRVWGIKPTIIVRNSIDKSRSYAINVGTDDPVCTNMELPGDFLVFRRHTGGFGEDELLQITKNGVNIMADRFGAALERRQRMEMIGLEEAETKALAYDAMLRTVLAQSKLALFNDTLFGGSSEYDPRTLFGFHGAITETFRDMNYATQSYNDRQQNLRELINERFGDRLPAVA